jgi:predicted nucleic acid-binding protein
MKPEKKNMVSNIFLDINVLLDFFLKRDGFSSAEKVLLLVNVIEADEEIVLQALNSSINDVEGVIHFYTATKHKLNYLISGDLDFQKLSNKNLQIISAKKFIELF